MCGRFSITPSKQQIEERFHATMNAEWKPNYNVAPTQQVPIILNENPREIVMARFGFVPAWAKDEKIGYKLINAKAETILEKPTYKAAAKHHRCLVIADGFYEWKKVLGSKEPYRIVMKKNKLFAFAGIWNIKDGKYSFSVITCKPNSLVKKIHDRMPVILPENKELAWLEKDRDQAIKLLQPISASSLKAYRVSSDVGNVRNNSEELIVEV